MSTVFEGTTLWINVRALQEALKNPRTVPCAYEVQQATDDIPVIFMASIPGLNPTGAVTLTDYEQNKYRSQTDLSGCPYMPDNDGKAFSKDACGCAPGQCRLSQTTWRNKP